MATPTATPTPIPTAFNTTVTEEQLQTTVLLYGSLGLLVVVVHAFLRTYVRSVYSPRKNYVSKSEVAPEPPAVVWRWFVPLLSPKSDDLVLKHVGLDAYITVRFLSLGFKLFAVLMPPGLIVLGSVYASLGSVENLNQATVLSIDQLTMQYVSGGAGAGTPVMWAPCVFVYIFTAIGVGLLHREYRRIVPLQREFMLYRHQATFTVLVERVPAEIHSRKALRRYFESIFPGSVLRIDVVPMSEDTDKLKDLVEQRQDVVARLEHAMLLEHQHNEKKETEWKDTTIAFGPSEAWMGLRGFCNGHLCHLFGRGHKVESVQYYTQRLNELNAQVAETKTKVEREVGSNLDEAYSPGLEEEERSRSPSALADGKPGGIDEGNDNEEDVEEETEWVFSMDKAQEAQWLLGDHGAEGDLSKAAAFVTFSKKTASTAVGRGMNTETSRLQVQSAPEPGDVNWSRIGCHPRVILATRVLVVILNLVLLVAFGVLTSTISATTNLQSVRQGWEDLDKFLQENEWLIPVMDQIAPLLLVIAFALVPPILNLILQLRFELSDSAKENSLFINYGVFLLIQMFLFYQISGAVLGVVAQSFENPREFVNLLAQMIPPNATFFMQFVTIRMLWVLPAELIRLGHFVVAALVRPIFCGLAKTPREKHDDKCGCRSFSFAGDSWHGYINAQFTLTLAIGVTYSVMAPLVLVFAFCYFGIALVVQRNQILYVYVKEFESGGSNWANLATAYLGCFVLLHITMLGIFALSEGPAQSVLMVPPMIATIGYACSVARLSESAQMFVSLSDARRFDIQNSLKATTEPLVYQHPCLQEPAEVHPTSVEDMLEQLQRLNNNRQRPEDDDHESDDEALQQDGAVFAQSTGLIDSEAGAGGDDRDSAEQQVNIT